MKDEKIDHYTLIKKINGENIVLQDPWFGDNYQLNINEFYNIWHLDSKFENRKKWIFAIKSKL